VEIPPFGNEFLKVEWPPAARMLCAHAKVERLRRIALPKDNWSTLLRLPKSTV